MAKQAKTEQAAHLNATLYSVVGSFAPSDFRFHQTDAVHAADLVASGAGVAPFRALPSVVLRTHQGYVGTNATYMSEKDMADEEKMRQHRGTNPGARDVASLDADKDVLVVVGSVKIVANYFDPDRCDNSAMAKYQRQFVEQYLADGQYPTLIRRYLTNLVNGTALWRNQYGFNRKTVISLRAPGSSTSNYVLENEHSAEFAELVDKVAALTKEKGQFVQLEVAMVVELGFDSEVYPSQPFINADDKLKIRNNAKSYARILATRIDTNGQAQVILSSNKVGNALRRVDLGYAEGATTPIAVELYGTVATERVAHRLDARSDYFSLVAKKTYETMTPEERHYIMSVYLKGGLLNFAADKGAEA